VNFFNRKNLANAYWFIIPPTTSENAMGTAPHNSLSIGLRIFPTHVVQYSESDRSNSVRSNSQLKNELNLRLNQSNGVVSYKSAKRIRNSVNWLVASSLNKRVFCAKSKRNYWFRLNFITLTLPSLNLKISDHQFKNKLLKNWIARMAYKHGLKNYVWKVETQANGNIHAHITTDCFIHYSEIRSSWNSILIKNNLMSNFADKFGHSDPNSTDVAAVRSIKDLAAYLSKYFSKSDSARRGVSGRLWSSSYSLSDSNVCNAICNPSDDDNVISPLVSCSAECIKIESEPNQFGRKRHLASVYIMRPNVWLELQGTAIHDNYSNRLAEIRTGVSQNSLTSQKINSYVHTKFNSKSIPTGDLRNNGSDTSGDHRASLVTRINSTRKTNSVQLDLFQSNAAPIFCSN